MRKSLAAPAVRACPLFAKLSWGVTEHCGLRHLVNPWEDRSVIDLQYLAARTHWHSVCFEFVSHAVFRTGALE